MVMPITPELAATVALRAAHAGYARQKSLPCKQQCSLPERPFPASPLSGPLDRAIELRKYHNSTEIYHMVLFQT